MKFSVWSSYYVDLSPEDAVLELEKNGVEYSEFSDEHGAVLLERGEPKEVGARFKEFADAHHVKFTQGHLWLRVRLCMDMENTVATLKKWLDMFEAIGIQRAVLHTDRMVEREDLTVEEVFQENVKALRQLTDYLAGRDMIICLENLGREGLNRNADDLLRFIDAIQSPNLGICLDTGHLNLTNDPDQGKFIRKAGKHLKALHIADNEGATDQHMIPFGRGTVDFIDVLRALRDVEYDGLFNYEVGGERKCCMTKGILNYEPGMEQSASLVIRGYKLEYMRKAIEYLESVV